MDKNKKSNKYLIINIVLLILLLSFNIGITNNALKEQPTGIAVFLGLTFIALCGYNIFLFIYSDNKKERIRLIINNVILIIASIFGFLGASNIFNLAIATFVFVLSASINALLKIFLCKKKPNIAVIISYALIAFVLFLMSFVAFIPFDEGMQYYITLIDFFIVFIIAIKNMLLPTLKFDRMKLFILI